MGVRLPAEYQEVQYIEGTGTQYIVTDINLSTVTNPSVDWTLKVEITAINKTQILAGADDDLKQIVVMDSTLRYDWCSKSTTKFFYTKFKLGSVFTIMQKDGFLWLDNESHEITTTSTSALKFGLFCKTITNNVVETSTISNMKLYSFEVKQDFTDIAKYVPCYRKADSKPGMYDLVTKQFFVNQGTGEFLAGPGVIDSISPLMVTWRRGLMMRKPKAYLYNYGEVGEFTGGFDIPREVWSGYNTFPTIEQDYVQFNGINGVNTFLPFRSAIDLSNYKNLVMDVEIESTLGRYLAVRGHVQSQPNTSDSYELVRTQSSTPEQLLGRTQIKIDVSAINQSAYVYFAVGGVTNYKWKLYRAWLE